MPYLTGRALLQLFLVEALWIPTCRLLLRCVGVCGCMGGGWDVWMLDETTGSQCVAVCCSVLQCVSQCVHVLWVYHVG